MGVEVSRAAVIAFRLAAHNLTERLGEHDLVEAAGRCGVQNSPPGSALLALSARVEAVTRAGFDGAVAGEKRLLQTWAMRGAPFYVPTADAHVFTAGVLPPTEASLRHFLPGLEQALGLLGMSVAEAVELTGAEIRGVLAGRRLTITDLGAEIAERVAARLPASQRRVWESAGPYASGQPLGEGVVHFCVRILTLQRVVCFAPRAGNSAPFVLVDEWLGLPISVVDPGGLRGVGRRQRRRRRPVVGAAGGRADAGRVPWHVVDPGRGPRAAAIGTHGGGRAPASAARPVHPDA